MSKPLSSYPPPLGEGTHGGNAKKGDSSRKDWKGSIDEFARSRSVEHSGKSFVYLGFPCGKMCHHYSTPSILAFLTEPQASVDTRLPWTLERDRPPRPSSRRPDRSRRQAEVLPSVDVHSPFHRCG